MSISILRLVLISALALSTPCFLTACSNGHQGDPEVPTRPPSAQSPDTPTKAKSPSAAADEETAVSTDNLEETWRAFVEGAIEKYAFDEEKTKQVQVILATCLKRATSLRAREKAATSDKEKKAASLALRKLNDQVVGRIKSLASIEVVLAAEEAGFKAPPLLDPTPAPEVGKHAPNFTLTGADGKPIALKSMRGKTVILHFWASWCGYCKRSLPEIKKIHEALKGDDSVVIWGINCRFKPKNDDPKEYFKENGYDWDLFLKGDSVARLYEVKGYPTTYVVGPDGKIIFKERGAKADPASRILPVVKKAAKKPNTKK